MGKECHVDEGHVFVMLRYDGSWVRDEKKYRYINLNAMHSCCNQTYEKNVDEFF